MTVKTNTPERVIDWDSLELEFIETPTMSMNKFAKLHDIPFATMHDHVHPAGRPSWKEHRDELYADVRRKNSERIANILEQDRDNDLSSFKALEDRVKRLALASLELIIPPDDAPLQAQLAAQTRLEQMSAKQLSEIINQSLRTLTETGRHKRLLMGQATALFGRADVPDVLIDEPLESAQALEMRSRMAQKALKASIEGSPLDVEFAVLASLGDSPELSPVPPDSPGSACPSSDSPDSPIPTTSHNAQDTEVRLACVTSKEEADDVPLGGL